MSGHWVCLFSFLLQDFWNRVFSGFWFTGETKIILWKISPKLPLFKATSQELNTWKLNGCFLKLASSDAWELNIDLRNITSFSFNEIFWFWKSENKTILNSSYPDKHTFYQLSWSWLFLCSFWYNVISVCLNRTTEDEKIFCLSDLSR